MAFTNEPVAYRWKSDLGYIYDVFDHGNGEPLYTTPPTKPLSDEEKKQLFLEYWGVGDANQQELEYITFIEKKVRKA
jgi:hypothetical protein